MLHSLVDSALNGKMWNFIKKNTSNACKFKNNAYLCTRVRETPSQHDKGWPVRLSVRTQDFHS